MQFKLSHCLLALLVIALLLGLITNSIRHRRETNELRDSIARSRDTLSMIHYGGANLQLLELHPEIWENPACSRFLKHELACSILQHWRHHTQIDFLTGTENYSRDFTARALAFFDCSSFDDFSSVAKSELWIYPSDPLLQSIFELNEEEERSFDTFLRSALEAD
jgi:hypothetical protein